MYPIKHAVMLAITQVGVIVVGVLAAGIVHKLWRSTGMSPPWPVTLLVNYGVLAFTIPLTWITFALVLRSRPEVSDGDKALAFWLGILVLIALAVCVVGVTAPPLLNFQGGMGGGGF